MRKFQIFTTEDNHKCEEVKSLIETHGDVYEEFVIGGEGCHAMSYGEFKKKLPDVTSVPYIIQEYSNHGITRDLKETMIHIGSMVNLSEFYRTHK